MIIRNVAGPQPTISRTRARRQAKQAAIVERARKCFQEIGYNTATVDDLLRYAGISRGTFYSYFESKSAVLIAIIKSVESDLLELCGKLGSLRDVSLTDFTAWLGDMADFFAHQPDVLEIWNGGLNDPDFLAFLQDLGDQMADRLHLRPATTDGGLRRDAMFTALFLGDIGRYCSMVTLSAWKADKARAIELIAEVMYRSFMAMIREDSTLSAHP